MGVQKSRRSIRHTKYSLVNNTFTNKSNYLTFTNKFKCASIYRKDSYKRSYIFKCIDMKAKKSYYFDN